MPNYSPEEIKYWKNMIYSHYHSSDQKVDDWVSTEQGSSTYGSPVRKKVNAKKWSPTKGASPTSYSATDDFLSGSPAGKKRGYKIKQAISKPDL